MKNTIPIRNNKMNVSSIVLTDDCHASILPRGPSSLPILHFSTSISHWSTVLNLRWAPCQERTRRVAFRRSCILHTTNAVLRRLTQLTIHDRLLLQHSQYKVTNNVKVTVTIRFPRHSPFSRGRKQRRVNIKVRHTNAGRIAKINYKNVIQNIQKCSAEELISNGIKSLVGLLTNFVEHLLSIVRTMAERTAPSRPVFSRAILPIFHLSLGFSSLSNTIWPSFGTM